MKPTTKPTIVATKIIYIAPIFPFLQAGIAVGILFLAGSAVLYCYRRERRAVGGGGGGGGNSRLGRSGAGCGCCSSSSLLPTHCCCCCYGGGARGAELYDSHISEDALRKKLSLLEGSRLNTHSRERKMKIYVAAEEKDG